MSNDAPPEVAAAQLVLQCSTGYIASSALQAVVKLKIADELANGPRTAADLAQATGVQEDALYRVLRALASVGVFEEREPRTFALNMAAHLLRADAPGSVRDLVLWLTDPFHFRVYAEMLHSVQTGRPAPGRGAPPSIAVEYRRDATKSSWSRRFFRRTPLDTEH